MYEIRDHPDAPSLDELREFVVEPIPPGEIRRRRDDGEHLVEVNLLDHDAVDAYVELDGPGRSELDIGTVLYRLVQLFGTPPFPEYRAGTDISWRDDTTFKYLFRARGTEESADAGRLVTVHDWHVRLGVSHAAWTDDPDTRPSVDPSTAIATLALVANIVTEPVECEYRGKWF